MLSPGGVLSSEDLGPSDSDGAIFVAATPGSKPADSTVAFATNDPNYEETFERTLATVLRRVRRIAVRAW